MSRPYLVSLRAVHFGRRVWTAEILVSATPEPDGNDEPSYRINWIRVVALHTAGRSVVMHRKSPAARERMDARILDAYEWEIRRELTAGHAWTGPVAAAYCDVMGVPNG